MILPIDRGRFDFERERDFDDLMFSVVPDGVWHCPKCLCPVARIARTGKVDRCQACEKDIFMGRPRNRRPASLRPNKHAPAGVTRGFHRIRAKNSDFSADVAILLHKPPLRRDGRNHAIPSIHILQDSDGLQAGASAQGGNRITLACTDFNQNTARRHQNSADIPQDDATGIQSIPPRRQRKPGFPQAHLGRKGGHLGLGDIGRICHDKVKTTADGAEPVRLKKGRPP